MRELLFKLKKDGKTVGYLRIKEINGTLRIEQTVDIGVWWEPVGGGRVGSGQHFIGCDSIHPFVYKDKNGKDVFAEDLVLFCWMGKKSKAKIVKDDLFTHLISCKGEVRGLPRTLCKSDLSRIELIEETK